MWNNYKERNDVYKDNMGTGHRVIINPIDTLKYCNY